MGGLLSSLGELWATGRISADEDVPTTRSVLDTAMQSAIEQRRTETGDEAVDAPRVTVVPRRENAGFGRRGAC